MTYYVSGTILSKNTCPIFYKADSCPLRLKPVPCSTDVEEATYIRKSSRMISDGYKSLNKSVHPLIKMKNTVFSPRPGTFLWWVNLQPSFKSQPTCHFLKKIFHRPAEHPLQYPHCSCVSILFSISWWLYMFWLLLCLLLVPRSWQISISWMNEWMTAA